MGQPIHLRKGDKTLIVYGRAQAAVHAADGWQVADENVADSLPQVDTAVSIDDMTIDELKDLADKRGVAYTWNIKVATLRDKLNDTGS